MSKLRVNSISDRSDEAAPSLTFGATIPSGEVLTISGNLVNKDKSFSWEIKKKI